MKIFLLIFLTVISFNINAYNYFKGKQELSGSTATILDKLWKATGSKKNKPKLIIVNNPEINARTTGNAIIVYTGMLNAVGGTNELAAVIGHEIGHIMLGHVVRNPEMDADVYGVTLANKAGYNGCTVRNFMKVMASIEKGDPGDGIHPPWLVRLDNLNKKVCGR